ncbi:MAG: glycosyltransferase [Eggerthellaceae bacterium]|nr:glycosyltransferase [Eggerthellaceae bacterium]
MTENAPQLIDSKTFWSQVLRPLFDELHVKSVVQTGRFDDGLLVEALDYLKTHSGKLVLVDSYPRLNDEIAREDTGDTLTIWPTNLDEAAALVPDHDILIITPRYRGNSEAMLRSALLRANPPKAILLAGDSANLASEWRNQPNATEYAVRFSAPNLAVITQDSSLLSEQTFESLKGISPETLAALSTPHNIEEPLCENEPEPSGDERVSFATRMKRGLARRARGALSRIRSGSSDDAQPEQVDAQTAFLMTAVEKNGISREEILTANREIIDAHSHVHEAINVPEVSVIVRASNPEHIKQIAETCFDQDDSVIGELIIVGNASSCAALNDLAGLSAPSRVHVVECPEGSSPARMNNIGAEKASCDYLLFLDGSCEPAPLWASELLRAARQDPSVGAIGSRDAFLARSADNGHEMGVMRQAGVSFEVVHARGGTAIQPCFRFSGAHALHGSPGDVFPVASVGGSCLLTTREAFDAVGGFDEGFLGEFENADYCLKLHKAGYQNFICPTSLVFSHPNESGSEASETASQHSNDLLLFQRRWQQFVADAMLSDIENGTALFIEDTSSIDVEALNSMCTRKRDLDERKILLVTPCDSWDNIESWGDYHFAIALKKQFERHGYEAVIRITPEWYEPFDGKYILALQGLFHYVPSAMHTSIMWNISHPDDFAMCEYDRYDKVFVASRVWAEHIKPLAHSPVEVMLQCTDPELFANDAEHQDVFELLFVGNTRGVFREAVQWLLPTTHRLDLFGKGWEEHVDPAYIKGEVIPNRWLNRAYSSCAILLNDHWADMRRLGFVSNRIFDGLASGAFILTDSVAGFEDELAEYTVVYHSEEELRNAVEYYLAHEDERRAIARKGQQVVLEKHTFEKRVETFLEFIESRD